MKEKSATVKVDDLQGPLSEQGQKIISRMANGEISPADASSMLQALSIQTRIFETEELEERVRSLEKQYEEAQQINELVGY